MNPADETVERGASDLDASDLTVDRMHMRFLERKHNRKEREIASAPAFTDVTNRHTLLERLDVAVAYNILGKRIDPKRAGLLARLYSGVKRLGQRGLLTGDFSEAYIMSTAGRESGVPDRFVQSLQPEVRGRLIRLAQ